MARLDLGLRQLRNALIARDTDLFGQCRNWTPADWVMCLVGEVGKAANFQKKIKRGDDGVDESDVGKELADALIYLDLWADSIGVDLADAVVKKFNEVSGRFQGGERHMIESLDPRGPCSEPLCEKPAAERGGFLCKEHGGGDDDVPFDDSSVSQSPEDDLRYLGIAEFEDGKTCEAGTCKKRAIWRTPTGYDVCGVHKAAFLKLRAKTAKARKSTSEFVYIASENKTC